MRLARTLGFSLTLLCSMASLPAEEHFGVGSKAPRIDIAHWLTDREPVAGFRRGHVYVIELWATWCGPCVASIPHLRDLQARHGEDVTIVSVSDEPVDTIESFLERERDGTTYREMANGYWLATDPDGSVKQDYMRAAGLGGIPTAFIVGKTGEVEWIGHPMSMDEPLAQVVANRWDRAAFARQMREDQEFRRKMRLAFDLAQQQRVAEALEMLDSMLAAATPARRQSIEMARTRIEAQASPVVPGAAPGAVGQAGPITIRKLAIGDQVTLPITGRSSGAIWGDVIYTLDSDPGTAAVHAGLVRDGETKMIRVWVVPGPSSFAETNRNGIRSRRWGPFQAAFVMQAAKPPVPVMHRLSTPPRTSGLIERLQVGESLTVPLTGSDKGGVWGTKEYTGDSLLEAAAVHAGALRVGERGQVVVSRVQPPERFEGSERNGVRSNSWRSYPIAFTVTRKPAADR